MPLCNEVMLREVYPVVVTQMQDLNAQLQTLDRSGEQETEISLCWRAHFKVGQAHYLHVIHSTSVSRMASMDFFIS